MATSSLWKREDESKLLRLKLKSFLRERGISITELADAIADALIASGDTVSDRFLHYLIQNTDPITPENSGKKPSLLKLGFIIKGLRHLTGERIVLSDILEYMEEVSEVFVARENAVLAGDGRKHQPTSHPSTYDLVVSDRTEERDDVIDDIWDSALQALKARGHQGLGNQLAKLTSNGQNSQHGNPQQEHSIKRGIPILLLTFLLASLSYIGVDHFILKPLRFERFTRLISFRDRVRPTSALPVPTLIGPEGDIDQLTPVLRISEVPGASAYEFYVENLVSNDGAYSGPVPNNSYPVPQDTLCPNTTYEWRARALGDDGWTSFSSPVYFTVTEEAAAEAQRDLVSLAEIDSKPAIPSIVAPVGSTNTTTPTLQVEFEPNIYGYGYYIRDLNTDKIVYDNNFATSNEIQVPEGVLEDGGVYQWNTRSRNCHYWSDFTEAQLFTVNVND